MNGDLSPMHESNMASFDLTVKIIFLGDYSVNKDMILHALSNLPEEPEVKFLSMRNGMVEMLFVRNEKRVRAKIIHTAGQERYRSITSSFYRGVHGCFLLFDVTQKSSFESLSEWQEELRRNTATEDVEVTLAGSNCHVAGSQRQVSKRTAQAFADYLRVPYREISVKIITTVIQGLEDLVDRIMLKASKQPLLSRSITPLDKKLLSVQEQKGGKTKGCAC